MSRKPTQYPKIIRDLKNHMNNDSLTITLSFGRKCLTETLYVSGGWEGNSYSISADINWRSGELKTTEMDVFQLVKLIRNKNITEMTHEDFSGLELIETRDGDTSFYDLEWDSPLTEEEQELAPSEWDMYNQGEINDSWYEFNGGIDSITIEVGDYSITITE
jgi:hypothetical protein